MAIVQGQYFDALEIMTSEERKIYQNRKLAEFIEYAYLHSSSARNLLDFVGLSPSKDITADDLDNLPITRKTELIEMQ
jgi:phenylacetate-CoA ligase